MITCVDLRKEEPKRVLQIIFIYGALRRQQAAQRAAQQNMSSVRDPAKPQHCPQGGMYKLKCALDDTQIRLIEKREQDPA